MGKKNSQLSLTDQLLLLEEMEETVPMSQLRDDGLAATENEETPPSATDQEFARLVKKLARAVEKTCTHLERRNSTAGAQLIAVADPVFEVMVVPDENGNLRGLSYISWELVAGFIENDVALLPDLHSLAVGFTPVESLNKKPEGWIPISVLDLFGSVTDEEVDSGTFKSDQIQPLLDWLKGLRKELALTS